MQKPLDELVSLAIILDVHQRTEKGSTTATGRSFHGSTRLFPGSPENRGGSTSSPPEPMQIGVQTIRHKSHRGAKPQRHCRFCGAEGLNTGSDGHHIPTDKTSQVIPFISERLSGSQFCVEVTLFVNRKPGRISAVIDSAATGNLITCALVNSLNIPVTKLANPVSAQALDGHTMGGRQLSYRTVKLRLDVAPAHSRVRTFFGGRAYSPRAGPRTAVVAHPQPTARLEAV